MRLFMAEITQQFIRGFVGTYIYIYIAQIWCFGDPGPWKSSPGRCFHWICNRRCDKNMDTSPHVLFFCVFLIAPLQLSYYVFLCLLSLLNLSLNYLVIAAFYFFWSNMVSRRPRTMKIKSRTLFSSNLHSEMWQMDGYEPKVTICCVFLYYFTIYIYIHIPPPHPQYIYIYIYVVRPYSHLACFCIFGHPYSHLIDLCGRTSLFPSC